MDRLEQLYVARIAGLLRDARLKAGLSCREVARRAGTSHATVLAYEGGRKVPLVATFLRILDACEVAVDFVTSPRIRHRDGLARGDELIDVLRLAEQFPARAPRHMEHPRLTARG